MQDLLAPGYFIDSDAPSIVEFAHKVTENLRGDLDRIVDSYAELYIGERWVKEIPAFDCTLCERVGLKPLEFDGRQDSLFHTFDREGRRHMEYLRHRGTFADVPFETIQSEFQLTYTGLMTEKGLLPIRSVFHILGLQVKPRKLKT